MLPLSCITLQIFHIYRITFNFTKIVTILINYIKMSKLEQWDLFYKVTWDGVKS